MLNEAIAMQPPARKQPGEWWFRLSAPQEPENATFAQRELVRRGRLASLTILVISLFTLVPLPITGANVGFLVILVATFAVNAFALFVLNRKGHLAAAGWLILIVLEIGFLLSFLSNPQGVSLILLPAFDLLIEALLVVVAFFRPRSIFVVMSFNILFIAAWLIFGRHSADISHLLLTTPYVLLYPSISLHLFVAIIAYLWVSSATKAISNLDRSEEIVALERREIEQQEEQIALKRQLEEGIQKLQETHVLVANGNFSARAPLGQENVLWRIAYSLNNLLARLERYSLMEREMHKQQAALNMLARYIQATKQGIQPVPQLTRTGTAVDSVIVETHDPTRSF